MLQRTPVITPEMQLMLFEIELQLTLYKSIERDFLQRIRNKFTKLHRRTSPTWLRSQLRYTVALSHEEFLGDLWEAGYRSYHSVSSSCEENVSGAVLAQLFFRRCEPPPIKEIVRSAKEDEASLKRLISASTPVIAYLKPKGQMGMSEHCAFLSSAEMAAWLSDINAKEEEGVACNIDALF